MVTNGLPCSSDTGSPVEPVSEGGTTSPGGSVSVVSVSAASSSSAPCPVGPFIPGLGPVASSSFYPVHPGSSFDLKENIDAWRSIPAYAASMYGSYPPGILAGYPMLRNGYAMDLNGSRRKNATRETTSTLKAWLNEHRKNPYPTKGEKVMLAIITQMTLTQVSTWFANARRRLKKENKMTWSPRNRCDDEEEEEDDCKEGNYNSFNENHHKEVEPECNIEDYDSSSDNLIEKKRFKRDDSDSGSTILSSYPPHGHPDLHNHHLHPSQPHPLLHPLSQQFSSFNQPLVHQLSSQLNCKILTSTTSYPHPSESSSSSPTVTIDHNQINNHQPPPATKPRIWSIVELATSSSASDTSETCVKHETK